MSRFLRVFLRFRWKIALSGMVLTAGTMVLVSFVWVVVNTLEERKELGRVDVVERVGLALSRNAVELRRPLLAVPADLDAAQSWMKRQCPTGGMWLRVSSNRTDCRRCELVLEVPQFAVADLDGNVLLSAPGGPPHGLPLADGLDGPARELVEGWTPDTDLASRRLPGGDTLAVVPFFGALGDPRGLVFARVTTAPPTFGGALLRFAKLIPHGLVEIAPFALVIGTVFSLVLSSGLLRRLRRLEDASSAWSRGDFERRVRDRSADELGRLGRALDDMADQLGDLLETKQELAALEERNHIARELHDTVKQQVFSISMLLGSIDALYERDAAAARRHLSEARELAGRTGRELNALILHLRPAAIEGKGLAGALREYCEAWSRKLGIESRVRVQGERALPLEIEQGLFRVAQEALANVAWHSGAKAVEIHLSIQDDAGNGSAGGKRMTLAVHDRGKGFDRAQAERRGFGIRGMRERVEQLGGRFVIESEPGSGTRVVADCPIHGV